MMQKMLRYVPIFDEQNKIIGYTEVVFANSEDEIAILNKEIAKNKEAYLQRLKIRKEALAEKETQLNNSLNEINEKIDKINLKISEFEKRIGKLNEEIDKKLSGINNQIGNKFKENLSVKFKDIIGGIKNI